MTDSAGGEVTELLQQLIRNQCVNDGRAESGHEQRSADLLRGYFEGAGVDLEEYEPTPGRASLVARIDGSDRRNAPSVLLMGHTDVVPVTPDGWSRDPFGGELVDGEVWGRGAVDMLNITASMAVAVKDLLTSGFRPRGDLIYLAVADEEAGGHHGAGWLVDNAYEAVAADYVLTESGGIVMPTEEGRHVTVTLAEKGIAWRRIRVRGTPAHGSMPYGTDNALVKAADVVRRLADYRQEATITDTWRAYVAALDVPRDVREMLVDPGRVMDAIASLDPGRAKLAHACTHMTFSPNVVAGGVKTNVVPDVVDLDVDIRTLPGETPDDVTRHLRTALGDLADQVEVSVLGEQSASTASPRDTPLWDAIGRAVRRAYPDAILAPRLTAGGTDARFFRDKGAVAYGMALFSEKVDYRDFASRFHGNDERVDVESLTLSTQLWKDLLVDVLG
ncbi:MAG TPA: M20/M25/M40 family metallo-hydrolase [Acidimicrobiales bacterium]|nr:M20/M25/M40 family metallo-hydrolase [Acidimicrobiales bacterium]